MREGGREERAGTFKGGGGRERERESVWEREREREKKKKRGGKRERESDTTEKSYNEQLTPKRRLRRKTREGREGHRIKPDKARSWEGLPFARR